MWRVSEKERQRRSFRCQNNDSCAPLFIYRKHNVPSSLLLAAENRPTADCRKTLGCWPLISLIVSSSIFNHSVVLHFKRSADLWSQLTREGLILETEAKNALGTLLGDFASSLEVVWTALDVESGTRQRFLVRMRRCPVSGAGGCLQRARGVFRASLTGVCWVCSRHPADTLTGRPAQCCAVCVCD